MGKMLNPFAPVNTPFKARREAEAGQVAAAVLAGLNLLTALTTYFHRAAAHSLLGGGRELAVVHLLFAALAGGLALLAKRALWAQWAILVWSLVELAPPATGALYGHAGVFPMPLLVLIFALKGIRGALAKRRLEGPAQTTM